MLLRCTLDTNSNREGEEVMNKLLIRKISTIFPALMLSLALGVFMGCEGDTGDRGPAGPAGPAGPVTNAGQSCTVCHGEGTAHDVAVVHPMLPEKLTIDNFGITLVGGELTACFSVTDPDGVGVDLTTLGTGWEGAFRFYLADIVPANTVSGDFSTDYLQRWAYERDSSGNTYSGAINPGEFVGDYCYTFTQDLTDATTLAASVAAPEALEDANGVAIDATVGDVAPWW